MLTVFNREKQKVAILSDLKDYVVRRKIKQGYVALAFSLYTEDANSKIIEDEFYIHTETENFIVKSISKQKTVNRYSCELNLEDLQNKMWADGFDNSKSDAITTARLAIAGTGWTVWAQDGLDMTNRRLKTDGMDALNVIYKIVEKYGLEVQFKTKEKQVCLYNAIGADKGSYFTDELNLTTLNIDTDTNSFATRLYVRGKNGATFADLNGGKDYVENFSYSKKLKCALWSDHRYEDMALMLKDAKRKLEDLCKPKASYEIEVVDLSKLSPEYSFLDYSIGDSITLISTQKQFRDVQRIVELTEYPLDPEMNSAILANTQLTFEEVQERNELMADYMDGVINDNGTIDGSKVEGIDINIPDFTIEDGSITANKLAVNSITTNKIQAGAITSDKIAAGSIDATKIQAGTITANSAIIDAAAIGSAQIANGAITNAHIKNGAIDNAKIDKLAVASANIKDAAIGTAKIQDAAITVAKIQDAFVDSLVATQGKFQSAHIGELESNNIKANAITTNKLAANSITTDKIQAKAITAEKMAVGSVQAGSIAAGAITADKIATGTITADKIKAGAITADKIATGAITTDKLSANSITTDKVAAGAITASKINTNGLMVDGTANINAATITTASIKDAAITTAKIANASIDSAKIKDAAITTAKIGNAQITSAKIANGAIGTANITDGAIITAKIGNAQITGAKIANATITDANIKELNASKITTGTLDASKITVRNLKADSITTGAITVQGENLIRNTGFTDGLNLWSNAGWTLDKENKFENVNTVYINRTGLTADAWKEFRSEPYPVNPGETFVASWYAKWDLPTNNDELYIVLWGYNAEGKGRVDIATQTLRGPITQEGMKRIILSGVVPAGITQIRVCASMKRNGSARLAKPMLSRGSVASIWKPHTDELISDGAITTDKIKDEAVSQDKVNVSSLFVSDTAFISNLKTVELSANQISTGTLTSNGGDLKILGLVSYDSLDADISKNFVFDPTANKTWIDGGNIYTKTIHANDIETRGFTVLNDANSPTFEITSSGDVKVDGELSSKNFSDTTGYKITTDGDAVFNQATIRGDVILPQAGMTNFGGQIGNENLATGTTEKKDFKGSNTENQCFTLFKLDYTIVQNRQITVSFDYEATANATGTFRVQTGGPYYTNLSDTVNVAKAPKGKMVKTLTVNTGDKTFNAAQVRLDNFNGTLTIQNVKVEYGAETTPWCPAKAEQTGENIRIWAGATYTDRDNAPFRVNQNGELFASKGTFSGKVASEEVNVGRIHLHDDAIVIDTSVAKVDEHGEIYTVQPLDDSGNPFVKLSPSLAQFNVDLNLGSSIKYKNSDNRFLMNGATLELTGAQALSKITYNPGGGATSGLNFFATSNGGQHVIRHSGVADYAGALIFDNEGVRGTKGDFIFTQGNLNGQVKVHIDGEANIKEKITNTKNNIEQRYTSKGVYFYAG